MSQKSPVLSSAHAAAIRAAVQITSDYTTPDAQDRAADRVAILAARILQHMQDAAGSRKKPSRR